ncbi:MAG TPA: glycoside hydrolase family 15 protein [Gaiellaceae bacterium]|nr:glycoside hydrolase family 15 protein [Gaiellaceae bacterium]
MTAFPAIADYAFLSDCETAALVAPSGSVEWLCLPRFDSPSVCAALLDRDAGSFRLGPADELVPTARRYLPGTLALETTWMTATGWLTVVDLLLVGPWGASAERPEYRRAPRDYRAAHVLLRIAECTHGTVDVALDCRLRFGYGATQPAWSRLNGDGRRAQASAGDASLQPKLRASAPLELTGGDARARVTLAEGERAFAALGWSGAQLPATLEQADATVEATLSWWRDWLACGTFPDHPWRSHLQQSAVVLKGLTYTPTGALLAAATTSLPETPGGERNWDYRYTWIRDSVFTLWALYTLGYSAEADDFFAFVAEQCGGERPLQIMYGIGGEFDLAEYELDHLSGYEGARPVRIGNAAYNQQQNDVWGLLLDSIYLHSRAHQDLPDSLWPLVHAWVEDALAHWREPDHGIWEVRGPKQHFTSSKVLCWVAADRGARLARKRGDERAAGRWQAAADEIHADVRANALDARGVFTQHYETTALDASNLLMLLLRFLPPDDERMRNTVMAAAEELTEDDLVLRYRVDETDDGLTGEEGTFTICSFWLVSALVEIGETLRARQLCEKLLSYASPLSLYAEEIDAHTGRQFGNFPQAFSHLALVNAVMHVIRAEHNEDPGRFVPVEAADPTASLAIGATGMGATRAR